LSSTEQAAVRAVGESGILGVSEAAIGSLLLGIDGRRGEMGLPNGHRAELGTKLEDDVLNPGNTGSGLAK
jgi:hypothetical protein